MNRPSESARDPDHLQAASHVALPIGRLRIAREDALEAVRDRLDRRQRVVDLVADDANQALPRLTLLVAQRLADVGHDEQLERDAALSEMAACGPPSGRCRPGMCRRRSMARRRRGNPTSPSSSAVRPSSRSIGRASSRSPARFARRSRRSGSNEKTATGNLLHHRAQQRGRFERSEALLAKRFGQRVHLDQHLAERVVFTLTARADREVLLTQRREQVRQRLQRVDDAIAQRRRHAPPEADDEERERPLHLRREVAAPQQNQRDAGAGQAGQERHQQDAAVVGQPALEAPAHGRHG